MATQKVKKRRIRVDRLPEGDRLKKLLEDAYAKGFKEGELVGYQSGNNDGTAQTHAMMSPVIDACHKEQARQAEVINELRAENIELQRHIKALQIILEPKKPDYVALSKTYGKGKQWWKTR